MIWWNKKNLKKFIHPPNNPVNWNYSISVCTGCVWHVIAGDNFSIRRWRGGFSLSLSLSLPVKNILIKRWSSWEGQRTRGDTAHREISFPALYGENSICWENLAERWEISPPNIDNHLFISWQQQKKKSTSLLWNGIGWVFPLFPVLFCGGREPISSLTCSSAPNHTISYYWRERFYCTGCIAERRYRRGLRSNSPTFVSLGFPPPGRICILMEGFYRLLCGVRGTTSGIIKWTKPD